MGADHTNPHERARVVLHALLVLCLLMLAVVRERNSGRSERECRKCCCCEENPLHL